MTVVEPNPVLPALEELKHGKQWVCFDREKIPYTPATGKHAKADDPATWGTYQQAVSAWRRNREKYAGVGREFLADEGLVGIDLDHCIDESGQIAEWATAIISRFSSYAEYSPSGRGVHIWVRGTIEKNVPAEAVPEGETPDGIEMYFWGRYFTVTGKPLPGTPATIERCEEACQALYEEVAAARQARKKMRQAHRNGAQQTQKPSPSAGGDTSYGLAALQHECDLLGSIGRGGRNNQLNVSAYAIGQLVGGGELSRTTAERELLSACDRNGLIHDEPNQTENTLKSGLEAGMQSPRSASPKKEKAARPAAALHEIKSHPLAAAASSNNGQSGNGHTPAPASPLSLPEVILGGQLHEDRDAALSALAASERQHPTLFVQSARLVQIALDEKKRPLLVTVGIAEIRNALSSSANYFKVRGRGDEEIKIPVYPSKDIADAILSLAPSQWPFPALEGVVETPVLRPDGTILDTPGYDAATRLYYIPQPGLKLPKVSANPTPKERKHALEVLLDAIGEFPYADDADRASALALLMTPVVRPAIKRHIPLGLIDAPKQGTGKGLLADTVALIATGKSAKIFTAPDNEDEWSKSILSLLIDNPSIIVIDNLTGKLQSAALDGTLTADEKQGRILGYSRTVTIPNRATWIATGNNIRLGGDLGRRSYRIRLDPQSSRPWMRTGFKHEDLASWVLEHRGELVAAILTLARAWFQAGKPIAVSAPALGTFTNWSKTMGGILEYAGVPGFLANLEQLYQEVDEETTQWEAFLETWHDTLGEDWQKTSQVIGKLKAAEAEQEGETLLPQETDSEGTQALAHFAESLPEGLQLALKDKPASFAIRLGRALEKRVDTCYGSQNLRLERTVDSHSKQKLWRVVPGKAGKNLSLLMPLQPAAEESSAVSTEEPQETAAGEAAPQAVSKPEAEMASTGYRPEPRPQQPDHTDQGAQRDVPPLSQNGRAMQPPEEREEFEL